MKQGSFKIYDNKYGTYVQLKYRDTGKTFYVFNVHPYPGVQDRLTGETACSVNKSGSACQEYSSFMNKLVSVLKNYKSSTIPMFVIGDLNVDDRSDSNPDDSTKRCTVSWWPCASLGKVGLVSNYTQAPVADTMRTLSYGSTYDNANTSHIVDYVFVPNSSRVTVLSTTIPNGESRDALWNGSDHNPVTATIEF